MTAVELKGFFSHGRIIIALLTLHPRGIGYTKLYPNNAGFTKWSIPMTTLTGNTKRTLQELSRIFNRLASELTTDLGHAVVEIEKLRREVQRLKSTPSKNQKIPQSSKSTKTHKKTDRRNSSTGSKPSQSSNQRKQASAPVIPDTDSEYIFPREPFNPPAPPEPSPPNN
ncbi:MAG TPA: hypothetical protein VE177_04590 [Candidatus Binatus sp.]|nr:hypothetical protein [Candidatus Binatus sp.]